MDSRRVAGVDWAGGEWLAVVFDDCSYQRSILKPSFEALWDEGDFEHLLVDVPIGLPENAKNRVVREELDSTARTVTGRPSSVFPVPSRGAVSKAYNDDADYDEVAAKNEADIGKGLSMQSYYIAAGIGEIDNILRENEEAKEEIIESHPEVCFRGLSGRRLQHSKNTAAGVGERLDALGNLIEEPGGKLEEITGDLVGESESAGIDDVLDAFVLGVVASIPEEDIMFIPDQYEKDSEGIPVRMAYWSEKPLL